MQTRERPDTAGVGPHADASLSTPSISRADDNGPTIIVWPRTSKLTACGTCREQLDANDYASRMRQFEQCANEFSERELGRPYKEFKGVSA